MSVRLVRESSTTPNIANKDDARMVRYAYGGYDGIVKSYGQELLYNYSNGIFKVGSGRVVLQGWEVDIDASGWTLNLQSVTGTRYYTVYLEVNLVTEKAELKSQYSNSDYPAIEPGDDLTNAPNGIANLVLYQFKLVNGVISSIEAKVQKINYVKDFERTLTQRVTDLENGTTPAKIAEYASNDYSKGTIEERLTKLGFKQGSVTLSSGTATVNSLTRQGNYVLLNLILDNLSLGINPTSGNLGTLPNNFKPLESVHCYAKCDGYNTSTGGANQISGGCLITIQTNGNISVSEFSYINTGSNTINSITVKNFGYEADSIK